MFQSCHVESNALLVGNTEKVGMPHRRADSDPSEALEALRIVLTGLDSGQTPDAIAKELIRAGLETKLRSDLFRSPHDRRRADISAIRRAVSDRTKSYDPFSTRVSSMRPHLFLI